jgi:hypothetical protein
MHPDAFLPFRFKKRLSGFARILLPGSRKSGLFHISKALRFTGIFSPVSLH